MNCIALTSFLVLTCSGVVIAQEAFPGPVTVDRSLPPSLANLAGLAPQANALRMGSSRSESSALTSVTGSRLVSVLADNLKLESENLLLKNSLQDLQLDRARLLLQDQGEKGNALRSSIWASRTIEVHWENPSRDNDQERTWVREAVTRTWERNSGLRFVGWDAATPTSRGIRIRIAEEGPHCKGLGKHLDGMVAGMVLNFSFQNWCVPCGVDRKGSIEKIAVHEFGHAIGFAHEQNRSDAPEWCQVERQGSDGDWYITIYDPSSVMNYCNSHWNNDGILSQKDIEAVQVLYGRPLDSPASPTGSVSRP